MPQVSSPASGSPINSAWADEVADAVNALPGPIGMVMWGFFTADPADFLLLDGRELSRTGIYAALYAAIGTYGGAGNGTTTWTLPDLRNRFPMVPGPNPAVGLGGMGGSKDAVLVTHTHPVSDHGHGGTSGGPNLSHRHWCDLPDAGWHEHAAGGTGGDKGFRFAISMGGAMNDYLYRSDAPSGTANRGVGITFSDVEGDGNHGHDGHTDYQLGAHEHTVNNATGVTANAPAGAAAAANANLPPYFGLQAAVKYR